MSRTQLAPPDARFTMHTAAGLSADEHQTLSIARLIVMALFTGATLFALFVAMHVMQQAAGGAGGGGATGSGGGSIPGAAAPLSTVVVLQLGWFTVMLFSVMGYPILRGGLIRPLVSDKRAMPDPDDDEQQDQTLIGRGYLTAVILGAALAEGLSLLGTVILLISGRMFNLTFATLPLLAFVFIMPTTGRLLKFRRNIHERRQLSLGP